MAVYGVTVHVYRVMRFYGCYWISLRILRMLLAIFFLLVIYSEAVYVYCSGFFNACCFTCFSLNLFVQYHCIWSHYNGDCPGQVVRAMPQPFVPYDYIGDPDLSVIPPPVVDYCCCCVIILPHGGNKFVFISFHFQSLNYVYKDCKE